MHRTTINFSDSLWREVQRHRGQSTSSDYIREAVLARIYFEKGIEGDKPYVKALRRAKEDISDPPP